MNIRIQGGVPGFGMALKSTQDRMERQAKRDSKVEFFENQKANLKNMECDTLKDISRKLDMLKGYDEQIVAARAEYNHSQVFKGLDEAREIGEKIAEAAEKYAPKTPEERLEEMAEEASGNDENEGMMSEIMDELSEITEEMQEELEEELQETTEVMEEQLTERLSQIEESRLNALSPESTTSLLENVKIPNRYSSIDIRI